MQNAFGGGMSFKKKSLPYGPPQCAHSHTWKKTYMESCQLIIRRKNDYMSEDEGTQLAWRPSWESDKVKAVPW